MPNESDWILYSPYDDRTLMRNIMTYDLARQMGYWAPRTKFCELLLNDFIFWNYKGVYVMTEKIKRDNNRVDIAKLDIDDNAGDSLTGGYIFAVDSNINLPDQGFFSLNQPGLFYAYKYPKGKDITLQQEEYLQAYMDSFENSMAAQNFSDPINGYRRFAVDTTFMDFFFIQELSKSVDCYKRSAYLYKDKNSNGGKLRAGPVWDFNAAWHNTPICAAYNDHIGWAMFESCFANSAFPVPVWWYRFFQDTIFTRDLKCRWQHYRSTFLDTSYIFHQLDSMSDYVAQGQVREYTQYGFTENFQTQIDSLKEWITNRITWMDAFMPGNCTGVGMDEAKETEKFFSVYPNPNSGEFVIKNFRAMNYEIEIYNLLGEIIFSRKTNSSSEDISLDAPSGIYLLKIKSADAFTTIKILKAR